MVFEYRFQRGYNHRMIVSINPNVFNETKEARAQLIGQLFRRLDAQIPFDFQTVFFGIKTIVEEDRKGCFCVIKVIEIKISNQEAEELLTRNNFKSSIPQCHEENQQKESAD